MESWEPLKVSKLGELEEFHYLKTIREIQQTKVTTTKEIISHRNGYEGCKDIFKAESIVQEVAKAKAIDPNYSGYTHSCGYPAVRGEMAALFSTSDYKLTENDVILFQGEDSVVNHIVRALCNPGDNFLIPSLSTGFWRENADGYGITWREFDILEDKNWEFNLEDLEKKIDSKTRFMVVPNGSGATGAFYSKEHLISILAVAEKHHIIVIADESYSGLSFPKQSYTPIISINQNVPTICMSGLGKSSFASGWRICWITF